MIPIRKQIFAYVSWLKANGCQAVYVWPLKKTATAYANVSREEIQRALALLYPSVRDRLPLAEVDTRDYESSAYRAEIDKETRQ